MANGNKQLVLAGSGHVHLAVLQRLAHQRPARTDITLVSDGASLLYSGMLPGHIAGHYPREALQIPLAPLAARAGVSFLQDRIVGLDADGRRLFLAGGGVVAFDGLSLAVGSGIDGSRLSPLADRLLPVRPIPDFLARWGAIRKQQGGKHLRLGVAGGGAGGLELALAVACALPEARIWLVVGEAGLLAGHPARLRSRAARYLDARGIIVVGGALAEPGGFRRADGKRIDLDYVIAATGAAPPAWIAASGLQCDRFGFVAVDSCFQSRSHPEILASGDIAAFPDRRVTRSGLHAVRAGPIVAHNLMAKASGTALKAYRPWKPTLYLLATRPGHALASGNGWSLEGEWLWWLKDRIDRAYVARHSRV